MGRGTSGASVSWAVPGDTWSKIKSVGKIHNFPGNEIKGTNNDSKFLNILSGAYFILLRYHEHYVEYPYCVLGKVTSAEVVWPFVISIVVLTSPNHSFHAVSSYCPGGTSVIV